MKIRTVHCSLRVNAMQYRYLCHEIRGTRQLYLDFCRYVQKDASNARQTACAAMNETQLLPYMKHYAAHYAPKVTTLELEAMLVSLMDYQKGCQQEEHAAIPRYFRCSGLPKTLYWRGIHLVSLLPQLSPQEKEPLLLHWELMDSAIWYQRHQIFLSLRFRKDF